MIIMSGISQVAFLEVGHGDSIVIIYPDGLTATIIDTPNSKLTFDFLEKHGIVHVDWAIVSHGDGDHYRGIASLVANLQNSGVAVSKLGYIRGDKSIRRESGYKKLRRQIRCDLTLTLFFSFCDGTQSGTNVSTLSHCNYCHRYTNVI